MKIYVALWGEAGAISLTAMNAAAAENARSRRYCSRIPFSQKWKVIDYTRPRVAIMADSWLKEYRVLDLVPEKANVTGCGLMDLDPHVFMAMNGFELETETSQALCLNLSRGSLTMDRVLSRPSYVRQWAEFLPQATIIGVGACDVITQGKRWNNPRSEFAEELLTFLKKLNEAAILHMTPTQWMWWNKTHRYLVLRPSDWSNYVSSMASLSPKEWREMRRDMGLGLKRKAGRFFREAGAIILAPNLDKPKISGVHLAPVSQRQFNNEVRHGVARILCRECKLPDEFILPAFKNILGKTICKLRPKQSYTREESIIRAAITMGGSLKRQKTTKSYKKVSFNEIVEYI